MSLYGDVQEQITAKLVDQSIIQDELCAGSDIDSLMEYFSKEGVDAFCVYIFNGGFRKEREPFATGGGKGRIWIWRMGMAFFLPYRGDSEEIESRVLERIHLLKKLLDDDHRLGGVVPFAEVISIDGPPEEIVLNDIPFTAFNVNLEFWEKS